MKNITNFFLSKRPTTLKQVDVLSLKTDDICFLARPYPYVVSDAGMTFRGVRYVELKNLKTGKGHLFTSNYLVGIKKEEGMVYEPDGSLKNPRE